MLAKCRKPRNESVSRDLALYNSSIGSPNPRIGQANSSLRMGLAWFQEWQLFPLKQKPTSMAAMATITPIISPVTHQQLRILPAEGS